MNLKIYTAILHTKGLENEDFEPKEPGVELWKRIYELMDSEKAFVAPSALNDGDYVFMGLEDKYKDKELHWLIEQDDMIGVYSDRKVFNKVWDEGKYEPDGCIYLEPENIEIVKELIKIER